MREPVFVISRSAESRAHRLFLKSYPKLGSYYSHYDGLRNEFKKYPNRFAIVVKWARLDDFSCANFTQLLLSRPICQLVHDLDPVREFRDFTTNDI